MKSTTRVGVKAMARMRGWCKICGDEDVRLHKHHFYHGERRKRRKNGQENPVHYICRPCHENLSAQINECRRLRRGNCRVCRYAGICCDWRP